MYSLETLKDYLLQTTYFLDNDYLTKYVNLIIANRTTKKVKFKTQQHHILPKKYFKIINIDVDNTQNNLVHLLYKDHILAHYFLCKCTISDLRNANVKALVALVNRDFRQINEDWIIDNLPDFQIIYEQQRKIAANTALHRPHVGHPHSEETKLKISKAQLGKVVSDNTKQKMRDHHYDCNGANNPATGRHWYNNGITRLYLKDDDIIPDGFIRGNLPKTLEETQRRKASLKGKNTWVKGRSWFNNGVNEIMAFECPIGYVKGRLPKKSNIEIK